MDEYFTKTYSSNLKGVAIILMFILHLLKSEWIYDPTIVWDLSINGNNISYIFSTSCDLCIGVFAFITGYSWYTSFNKNRKFRMILNIYFSYWVMLFLFALPIRVLLKEDVSFTLENFIYNILAIESRSISFGWYVLFYAIAVVTYKHWYKLFNRFSFSPFVKMIIVCMFFFFVRGFAKIISKGIYIPDVFLDIISHYFQCMPIIIVASMVREYRIFEITNQFISDYFDRVKISLGLVCGGATIVILILKSIFQYLTGIYSNMDSFIIVPFMYCLIGAIKSLRSFKNFDTVLRKLGGVSVYMWLSHRVLLYDSIQAVLYQVRIPVFIIIVSLGIMYPIGLLYKKIDSKLKNRFAMVFIK